MFMMIDLVLMQSTSSLQMCFTYEVKSRIRGFVFCIVVIGAGSQSPKYLVLGILCWVFMASGTPSFYRTVPTV